MDINDFFNTDNAEHLEAYAHFRDTGQWPPGFLSLSIEYSSNWQTILAHRIAARRPIFDVGRSMFDVRRSSFAKGSRKE